MGGLHTLTSTQKAKFLLAPRDVARGVEAAVVSSNSDRCDLSDQNASSALWLGALPTRYGIIRQVERHSSPMEQDLQLGILAHSMTLGKDGVLHCSSLSIAELQISSVMDYHLYIDYTWP